MTRVYFDPTALVLGGLGGGGPVAAGHPAPGAGEAIENLREAGLDVFAYEPEAAPGRDRASDPRVIAQLGLTPPDGPPQSGSWLVTADPRQCQRRPAGVRTILVGPRRPPGPRPTAHCDVEARDLVAAAIEIITREAMS